MNYYLKVFEDKLTEDFQSVRINISTCSTSEIKMFINQLDILSQNNCITLAQLFKKIDEIDFKFSSNLQSVLEELKQFNTSFICYLYIEKRGRTRIEPQKKHKFKNIHLTLSESDNLQMLEDKLKYHPTISTNEYIRTRLFNTKIEETKSKSFVHNKLLLEVNKIGVNVNQIAKKINSGHLNMEERILREIEDIQKQLLNLFTQLK